MVGDAAFARAFERGDIPNAEFDHAAHIRLALAYLQESACTNEAVERMAAALRRFATSAGHPEKYHHTLTVFWMLTVARLLDKNLPHEYYSRERLWSETARTSWVEPDLRTLDGATPHSSDSPRDASHRAVSR